MAEVMNICQMPMIQQQDTTIQGNNNTTPITGDFGSAGAFSGKSNKDKMAMCGITSSSMGPADTMNAGLITKATFNVTGGKGSIMMNKNIVADFRAICDEILKLGWFKLTVSSGYRDYNSVKKGVSRHCWGTAIDINAGKLGNPYFNTRVQKGQAEPANGAPEPWPTIKCPYGGTYDRSRCMWHWGHPVVQIFLKHGWGWGGSYGDVMHFSLPDGR